MKILPGPTKAYVGSFFRKLKEPYLESIGFASGMLLFAIPNYGVMFKCRADGSPLDLEFGAFFALLRFIKNKLPRENIKQVDVLSSSPEFVFAIANKGRQVVANRQRRQMLEKYEQTFAITVSYVSPERNLAHSCPADYPSLPSSQTPVIKPDRVNKPVVRFRPIQKGVRL